jgi:hypothetical protein
LEVIQRRKLLDSRPRDPLHAGGELDFRAPADPSGPPDVRTGQSTKPGQLQHLFSRRIWKQKVNRLISILVRSASQHLRLRWPTKSASQHDVVSWNGKRKIVLAASIDAGDASDASIERGNPGYGTFGGRAAFGVKYPAVHSAKGTVGEPCQLKPQVEPLDLA